MPPMYTDAKDWLEQNADNMSVKDIISFVINEVSNDDIERWFGVNMDDDCDNPGAGTTYCSECHSEVNDQDYDTYLDMCFDCVATCYVTCIICGERVESDDYDSDLDMCHDCADNHENARLDNLHAGYSILCPRDNKS